MKLIITINTETLTDLPWPEGVPLPAAGDEVTLNHAGARISVLVDRCAFDLTADAGGAARVQIRGHHAPAGSI
jgi:hypothetical protein